ncbi:MAG: ATP-binding protein [Bacteroides sp.]
MNEPEILQRRVYIERIAPFMRTPVVKVLVGARRVGKSCILFQLMQRIRVEEQQPNIIYINKEDLAFADLRTYRELNDYLRCRLLPEARNYIFIDEVQEIEEFGLAIRSLALNPLNDIYITGSNSQFFSSDLAHALGGRHIAFRIYSLAYSEFLQFHALEDSVDAFEKYVHFGGLPYLRHLPLKEEVVSGYLRSIYDTIVLRDVVARNAIRHTRFLEQLVRYLADNVGSLFSAKSISDFLKSQRVTLSPTLVSDYVDALPAAYFIHRLARYDIVGKRLFERGEKFFFEDLGIRNVIVGYKPQDRAKRLENLVCNHLLFCGYDVTVGALATEKINFVATRNGERLYVQVATELERAETLERELGNLLRIKDNYPKLVVTSQENHENSYEGVVLVGIREFLTHSILP